MKGTTMIRILDTRDIHELQVSDALLPPTQSYPWHSAPLDPERLRQYLAVCMARGIVYALGAKAGDIDAALPDYDSIDCSGWVRAGIAVATHGQTILPDGSVNQNEWCAAQGLKRSTYAACRLQDGLTRIAFIRPSPKHAVGHVYLTRNGRTLESWGGHGPGSRLVSTHVLSTETTDVYVLAVRL